MVTDVSSRTIEEGGEAVTDALCAEGENIFDFQLGDDMVANIFAPCHLVSLFDMLRVHAYDYIRLGKDIKESMIGLQLAEAEPESPLTADELRDFDAVLTRWREMCRNLNMPTSIILLDSLKGNPPRTRQAFDMLVRTLKSEIQSKLFLYIPEHVAKYYEENMPILPRIKSAFPTACKELVASGNCIAVGLHTASVFHAMRAAEMGLRVIAKSLSVSFLYPLEMAQWQNIIEKIDAEIDAMKKLPKSTNKDKDLQFYSEIAVQFRYFKDAWRNHVAHARSSYNEREAMIILDHMLEMYSVLSNRLDEAS